MKWILSYLRETTNVGLVYNKDCSIGSSVIKYVNSDYASNLNKRRYLTSFFIYFCYAMILCQGSKVTLVELMGI